MNKKFAAFFTIILTFTALNVVGESSQCSTLRDAFNVDEATVNDTYDMATCEAAVNNRDEAFTYLSLALYKGFHETDWMLADTDLESLHQDPRWLPLVTRTEKLHQAHLLASLANHQ